MEHSPFNMADLREFMQGLVDGGPTKSGHRTPTVIAVLPLGGINETVMWSNYWMVEQVLGSGVHGVLLAHARSPEVVKVLVQATRHPHAPETEGIGEGLRGSGGQGFAEWGPGDMRMSFDVGRAGMPQILVDARARVLAATRGAGIAFLNQVNIKAMIEEGVRIGANPGVGVADQGRRYMKRQMPW